MAEDVKSSSELAANLTIAWLNNPNVRANTDDVTTFLESVHSTLRGFSAARPTAPAPQAAEMTADAEEASTAAEEQPTPAVTVKKSLASREHIISLIDGKPYRTLKRHLGTHGLTPLQYRQRYGLKPDYPMVAPAYAERRSALAKQIGLGSKGGRKAANAKSAPAAATPATATAASKPPTAKRAPVRTKAAAKPAATGRKRGRPPKMPQA